MKESMKKLSFATPEMPGDVVDYDTVQFPLKPRNPFFRAFSQLLKLRFTAMVTYSIHSSVSRLE